MLQDLFELVGKIRVDTTGLDSALQNAKSKVEGVGQTISNTGKTISDFGGTVTKKATLPIVAIGTAAAHSAIAFESSFAGVRKTVDATEEEFGKFRKTILDMSTDLPATANEIAAVWEMGGQLGIANEALEGFSRTIIDLGESTNLTLDQAATSFAQFANIAGMSQNDFDRLGSSVVALGNTMATTESEIVGMSMRLVAQGKQIGMTESEIMALSAAMNSLGIKEEMGGTAMTTVLKKINAAVGEGGKSLEAFAQVAGMSSEEFQKLFNENAVGGLDALIKGLSRVSSEGGNVAATLEDLGMKGIYESDVMQRLSGAPQLLGEALETSNNAWKENTALSEEAAERYATTESQLRMLKNEVTAVAIQFGEIMIPILLDLVRVVKPVIEWFGNLSDGTKRMIVFTGALVAIIGPLLMMLGFMLTSIGNIVKVIGLLGGGVGKSIGLLGRLSGVFGTVGKVIGTLAGVATKGAGVFARFLPMIGRFATMIPRLFNPLGLAITAFLVVWNLILKAFGIDTKEAISLLINAIKEGAAKIGEWLTNLGNAIVEGLSRLLEWAVELFTGFIDGLVEMISNFISVAQAMWDAIINAIVDFVVNAIALITQFVLDVIAWFMNLFNEAKRIIELMVTTVIRALTNMVQNAIKAAKEFVSAIVGGFQKAWQGAMEFVGKAASLGLDFAKGIARGIRNGAKFLKDAVVGIGKSAVSAFTDFFKIKSPSRLMAGLSKWIPGGAAQGILDNVGMVGNAMRKFGGTIKSGYDAIIDNLPSMPSIANILPQPRHVALEGVNNSTTSSRVTDERDRGGGDVNVYVRKTEDASTKTIQNKVERNFFKKARQRE